MSSWKRQKRYMESSFNFTSLLKRCRENWSRSREEYPEGVRERVNQLLRQQIRKYAYLIKA